MSTGDVENIHIRIRQELERLGLSLAEAARRMGEADSQGVRDVCSGRKRVTAEFLAKLVEIQGDVLFVLTGKRLPASRPTCNDHTDTVILLQNRGIYPDGRGGGTVNLVGLALLLDYARDANGAKPVALTEKVLAKVARYSVADARPWLLQPVALVPRKGGPASHTVLIYREKTPVSLLWQLGPFAGEIPPRIELTGHHGFPLKWRADDEDNEDRWELDLSSDGSFKVLDRGETLKAQGITVQFAGGHVRLAKAMAAYESTQVHVGGDVGQIVNGDQTVTAPMTFNVGKGRK